MGRPQCAWVLPGAPADSKQWRVEPPVQGAPPTHLRLAASGDPLVVSVVVTLPDSGDVSWELWLVARAGGERHDLAYQLVPRGGTGTLTVDLARLAAPPVGRWRFVVLGRAVDAWGPEYAPFESAPAELLCLLDAPTGAWRILAALAEPQAATRRPPLGLARLAAAEAHGARTPEEAVSLLARQLWATVDHPAPPGGYAFRYGADDWASPGPSAPWNLFGFLAALEGSTGFGATRVACDGASSLVGLLAGVLGVDARRRSANLERGVDLGPHLVFPGVAVPAGAYMHHTVVSFPGADGRERVVDPTLAPGPGDVARVWTLDELAASVGGVEKGWTWTEPVPPMITDEDNPPVPGPATAEEHARREALWTPGLRGVEAAARALVRAEKMRWLWMDLVPVPGGGALRLTLAHPDRRRFVRVDAMDARGAAPLRERLAERDGVDWGLGATLPAAEAWSALPPGGEGRARLYALEGPAVQVVVRDLGAQPSPLGALPTQDGSWSLLPSPADGEGFLGDLARVVSGR